jgi:hypothetical protein
MSNDSNEIDKLPADLCSTTTPEERFAMVWQLTVEEWARRGEVIPEKMDKSVFQVIRIEKDASGKTIGHTVVRQSGYETPVPPAAPE